MLNKVDIKIKITHEGEVNRARVMPQNSVSQPQSEQDGFILRIFVNSSRNQCIFHSLHKSLILLIA